MGPLVEEFEKKYWDHNQLVVGIDEAGRGPMAGPCMVGAVIFPIGFYDPSINDSKKLSKTKRDALVDVIKKHALWFDIITIDVETIDRLNIYRAVQDAMTRLAIAANVDVVLTDAMPLELVDSVEVVSIVKGDQRSMSIAAASILAKTSRDQYMEALDAEYPEYGFAGHKGYGTAKHKQAILKYGRTQYHRKSFKFKDETQISLDI